MIDSDLTGKFKGAMRRYPSGVTVVTAAPESQPPQAITVSAFCSVSLDPPLVLVCLNNNGRAATAIAAEQCFTVNVLSADQQEDSRACTAPTEDRLATVEWQPGSNGVPVLARACAVFECERYALHPAGDHVILVGRVTNVRLRDDLGPLAYHDGTYVMVSPLTLAG
jgi:flavin reductase (DIM6/NTAB) family NADH-FMN oxidoreductase RutF